MSKIAMGVSAVLCILSWSVSVEILDPRRSIGIWFLFWPYFLLACYGITHLMEEDKEIWQLNLLPIGAVCVVLPLSNLGETFLTSLKADGHTILAPLFAVVTLPIWVPTAIIGPFLFGYCLCVCVVPVFMSIQYFLVNPDELQVAFKAKENKRPSAVVEKEFAAAMKSGIASDIEIARLLEEMPFYLRAYHEMIYRFKAMKQKSIRDVLKKQNEAMKERMDTAEEVHDYERTKRAYDDLKAENEALKERVRRAESEE